MQNIYFDIPAGAFERSTELQHWAQHGYAVTEPLRRRGYDRVRLQAKDMAELYDLAETVTFQESVRWILQEEGKYYRQLLEQNDYVVFRQQANRSMEKLEPQLRAMIRKDIELLLQQNNSFNISGYLRFSAHKLKALMQRVMEEEYHRFEEELEQEEFIELLRFFVSIQPPLLDEAHLTIYQKHFTLTDEWGNDLRKIYLESLLEEEIADVSDNDLIMSILITLLPRTIYLRVQEPPESRDFLLLLQQVFGEQIIWRKAERTEPAAEKRAVQEQSKQSRR